MVDLVQLHTTLMYNPNIQHATNNEQVGINLEVLVTSLFDKKMTQSYIPAKLR